MSDLLTQTLSSQLAKHDVSLEQWKELLQRLLDYGVLCREDSLVEADFYDCFIRIEPVVQDYLSLMGISLEHERHFQYVRVCPPNAKLPGQESEHEEGVNTSLRLKLSQHEVAIILVLRAEYDKSLRDGAIDDQGCATLSIEALNLSLKSLLKRSLPEHVHERRQYFRRLRQMRLIHYAAETDLDTGDGWVKVRPTIISIVSNEWLASITTGLLSEELSENTQGTEQPIPHSLFVDQ